MKSQQQFELKAEISGLSQKKSESKQQFSQKKQKNQRQISKVEDSMNFLMNEDGEEEETHEIIDLNNNPLRLVKMDQLDERKPYEQFRIIERSIDFSLESDQQSDEVPPSNFLSTQILNQSLFLFKIKNSKSNEDLQTQPTTPNNSTHPIHIGDDCTKHIEHIKDESVIFLSMAQIQIDGKSKVDKIILTKTLIQLGPYHIPLASIDKVKITHSKKGTNPTIKINAEKEEFYFTIQSTAFCQGFPIIFYCYSQVVKAKLINLGIQLAQTSNTYLQIDLEQKDSDVYGNLLKKSQYLGKWENRAILMNSDGLFSSKDNGKNAFSFSISKKNVKSLWTRFDIIEKKLVIKLMHEKKTEFAIPIGNSDKGDEKNWLWHFYKLMI